MLTLAVALGMATSSYGQHSFTPEDIANGGQLYRSNCLSCHGPNGDAVPNSPLMNGKFRRGNSDEELIKIIRSGISGTAMVAQPSLNEAQAGTIVGFLRSVATSIPSASASAALPSGDPGRGKQLFEGKGNCLSCHKVADKGSQFGPDLSSIGSPAVGRGGRGGGGPAPAGARGATAAAAPAVPPVPTAPATANLAQLQESIVDPNATVSNTNRYVLLSLKDGSTVSGKLLNQDTFAIQILDYRESLKSVSRSTVRDVVFKSPMPSYREKLSLQELADVVSYLATLKGQTN